MVMTLGAFVVVLGVLIFVHELGHFLAAKSVDIAVLRFSLGFGPLTPLKFRRGETEYCVSWVPLGGYVKMAGLEDEGAAGGLEGPRHDAPVPLERTFDAKPLWARIFVISAGVMMNMIFAVLVYTGLTMYYGVAEDPTTTVGEVRADDLPMGAAPLATLKPGERIVRIDGDTITGWRQITEHLVTSTATPMKIDIAGRSQPVLVDVPLRDQEGRARLVHALAAWHDPVAGEVVPGFPASQAGLHRGDRIIRINGDTMPSWESLVKVFESSAAESLSVTYLRDGRAHTVPLTPRATRIAGDSGKIRVVGRIGIGLNIPLKRYGLFGSLGQGARRAAEAGGIVLFTLKGLLTGQLSPKDLGGPILVGQLSGEAARLGPDVFLGFMALFSMNLAILNLMPIPVLDGGHLLFLFIEGVRRRPLSVIQRQRLTNVGFFLLVAIMLLAMANDLQRVLPALLKKLF